MAFKLHKNSFDILTDETAMKYADPTPEKKAAAAAEEENVSPWYKNYLKLQEATKAKKEAAKEKKQSAKAPEKPAAAKNRNPEKQQQQQPQPVKEYNTMKAKPLIITEQALRQNLVLRKPKPKKYGEPKVKFASQDNNRETVDGGKNKKINEPKPCNVNSSQEGSGKRLGGEKKERNYSYKAKVQRNGGNKANSSRQEEEANIKPVAVAPRLNDTDQFPVLGKFVKG